MKELFMVPYLVWVQFPHKTFIEIVSIYLGNEY